MKKSIIIVLIFWTQGLFAQERSVLLRIHDSLQVKLKELQQKHNFPGLTVGFVLKDGTSSSLSVGWADIENKIKLKPEDKLLSGSIGKTYVAAVVMQLIAEKKLKLDDLISTWFQNEKWFSQLPNNQTISVKHLLNHTSGIAEYYDHPDFLKIFLNEPDKVMQPVDLVAFILNRPLLFAVGEGWSYADTNYLILGMIIEKITQDTYYKQLKKRILKPFRLSHTRPSDSREIKGLVSGYSMPNSLFGFEGRTIIDGKMRVNPKFEWTGGGLASTAEDLAKWAKILYEAKAFSADLLNTTLENAPEAKTGKGDKYGLGVQIRPTDFGLSYGHGGWFPGYLSEMEYFPDYQIAVAIQINTDDFKKLGKHPKFLNREMMQVIVNQLNTK